MNYRLLIAAFSASLLVSCRGALAVANVETQKNISIDANIPEDPASAATIIPYKKSMDAQMNGKISFTAIDLTKSGDNSNLGNLLADYTFEGADEWAKSNNIPQIDAAVINIGGIRSTINKGDILLRHVYEVMPFENEVVIVKMSGTALEGLFDYYLQTRKNNPVSHLEIETENGKITKKMINGKAIDANKTYYIATSDYLAFGGDNMKFFSNGEMISTGIKLRDLFIDKFKADNPVEIPSDIRLNFKDKKTAP